MTHSAALEAAPTSGAAVELKIFTLVAGEQTLLDGASARFEPGEITLIVGCSGVGKSMLLRALSGLVHGSTRPVFTRGEIQIGGTAGKSRKAAVGVVFQHFALFDELSPLENVQFAAAHRAAGSKRVGPNPEALLDELRVPRHRRISALSGGQKQRLAIARTLSYNPEVVLYDEPTSGLDVATAAQVAALIERTHRAHPTTSIVVTHDIAALAPIADRIYLFDAESRSLCEVERERWDKLREELEPPAQEPPAAPKKLGEKLRKAGGALREWTGSFFAGSSRVVEEAGLAPLRLLPLWRRPYWGLRFFAHYLRLVAGPSAWIYLAVAGIILGFVTTHFTFRFLPYASYTQPLLIEDLLISIGFALYRILTPILATILIAARCGAAVAADVGGKTYTQQMDALRTFNVRPPNYLLTGSLWAFLIGTPLLTLGSYFCAALTSLAVFTYNHPSRGPLFWEQHFHRFLRVPGEMLYDGTPWMLAKTLVCATGIALISYHLGARPKQSSTDVSRGVTATILWSTLHVLVTHFAFAFYEFE